MSPTRPTRPPPGSRPRSPPGRSAGRGRRAPAGTRPSANATTAPAPCSPPARRPRAPASAGSPLYVTTTVTDPDLLPAAVADLEQRAGQAKLRLRRLRGSQAAGFAAALGVGVNPATAARHRTGR